MTRAAGPRDPGREDGQEHRTEAVAVGTCRHCHARLLVRAEGRPRQFCDATCRVRFARKSPTKQRPWK